MSAKTEQDSNNTLNLSQKDWGKLQQMIENTVSSEIQAQFQTRQKAWKISEESIFATLESLQNSITFMQKEFNHKIGGIRSRETARTNQENTFEGLEQAIAQANKIREMKGLPKIELPSDPQDEPEQAGSGFGRRTRKLAS